MLPGVKARLPLLLAMAALLIIAAVASRGTSAVHPGPQSMLPAPEPKPTTTTVADEKAPNGVLSTIAAIGLTGVLVVFLVLFVIGLVVIAMSMSFTRRRRVRLSNPVVVADSDEGTTNVTSGTVLRSALAAAQRDLEVRRPGPPSDAVVAAWLRLEQAAADSGAPRAAHQTPTEFTSALLGEHVADDDAVGRLRGLYQRARFAPPRSITEADAEHARVALGEILDGWRVPT